MLKALATLLVLVATTTPFTAEALPLPASCLRSPLPATPTPPTFSLEIRYFSDRALGTVWREACQDGSGQVAVLIRLTAVTTNPLVCSNNVFIVQDGQRDGQLATSTSGQSPFCGSLSEPTTVVLLSRFPQQDYDETAAFSVIYDGPPSTSVTIPAAAPPHTLVITAGPSGIPNPVASGASASLSVTAVDSLAHGLSYAWASACPELSSNGVFSDANAQNPVWTAPPNISGLQKGCSIQVTVSDGQGLTQAASFGMNVNPAENPPLPVSLAGAAILPGSRAVQVGATATAFATMIASGPGTATGCTIAPTNAPQGTAFQYQQTNAANAPIGQPNTPATIAGGAAQPFVISLTPSAPFPATEIQFAFDCANTAPVTVLPGVNTLLLSATSTAGPDLVALGATTTSDGIANIPGATGTGFFAVATVNVGASASITATADTGSATLPVVLTLCQTNPANGACVNPAVASSSATVQIDAGATPTFAVFVQGTGTVAFNPGVNRVFVRFKTAGGATVGATSVAVRTQ